MATRTDAEEFVAAPTRLQKRFWLGGTGVALFVLTLAIGNAFAPPDKRLTPGSMGHDFLAFYTAGTFAREGHAGRLYDLPAVRGFQQSVAARHGLEIGSDFGPYWNPPFYAWAFAPLSLLPYPAAWAAWCGVNVLAVAGAVVMLVRIVRGAALPARVAGWATWGLVPLLVGVSFPLVQALGHGQNTGTSLLILAGVATLWRGRRAFAAGCVVGLLFYKPQLGAVVAGMLVLSLGRRALAGVAATGAGLLLATVLSMPGALADWLARLPGNLRHMQVEHAYLWERHVTLKAFWRMLLQGRGAGEMSWPAAVLTTLSVLVVAASLAWAWYRTRRLAELSGPALDRLIAATVAATPLLMPFYFDYDLLLLAVPATLLAGERMAGAAPARSAADRWLISAWAALYACLFVNPALTAACRVNVAVVLTTVVAGLSIARAGRRRFDLTTDVMPTRVLVGFTPPLPKAA